ncbi:MAG: hypothetical protein RL748_3437 [Pseudomonadota bacterium]|jgi:hypothetical protein
MVCPGRFSGQIFQNLLQVLHINNVQLSQDQLTPDFLLVFTCLPDPMTMYCFLMQPY